MSNLKTKKVKKVQGIVNVYVQSSFNNTIITATDATGAVIAWSSSGAVGFKGTRKSSPFAAQVAVETLVKKLKAMAVSSVKILMKGLGTGRESVIKGMHEFSVLELIECTPERHNGTRLPKRRRA